MGSKIKSKMWTTALTFATIGNHFNLISYENHLGEVILAQKQKKKAK